MSEESRKYVVYGLLAVQPVTALPLKIVPSGSWAHVAVAAFFALIAGWRYHQDTLKLAKGRAEAGLDRALMAIWALGNHDNRSRLRCNVMLYDGERQKLRLRGTSLYC